MGTEDKQRYYILAQTHLRKAVEALRELQVLFEDDENIHDMATVEDRRSAAEDLQVEIEEMPEYLLSKELE